MTHYIIAESSLSPIRDMSVYEDNDELGALQQYASDNDYTLEDCDGFLVYELKNALKFVAPTVKGCFVKA